MTWAALFERAEAYDVTEAHVRDRLAARRDRRERASHDADRATGPGGDPD
ncbi:MAG: hypothetical protein ABEJ92_09410 [Halobacteriales archaeon]